MCRVGTRCAHAHLLRARRSIMPACSLCTVPERSAVLSDSTHAQRPGAAHPTRRLPCTPLQHSTSRAAGRVEWHTVPPPAPGAEAARRARGGRDMREALEREHERTREAARERARLLRADAEDPDSDEDDERWRRKPLATRRARALAAAAAVPVAEQRDATRGFAQQADPAEAGLTWQACWKGESWGRVSERLRQQACYCGEPARAVPPASHAASEPQKCLRRAAGARWRASGTASGSRRRTRPTAPPRRGSGTRWQARHPARHVGLAAHARRCAELGSKWRGGWPAAHPRRLCGAARARQRPGCGRGCSQSTRSCP